MSSKCMWVSVAYLVVATRQKSTDRKKQRSLGGWIEVPLKGKNPKSQEQRLSVWWEGRTKMKHWWQQREAGVTSKRGESQEVRTKKIVFWGVGWGGRWFGCHKVNCREADTLSSTACAISLKRVISVWRRSGKVVVVRSWKGSHGSELA
jgi:hypothetical protein